MSASFGTAFGDLIDAKNAYNHNVFHVYTPDKDVSLKLKDALLSEEAAIDYLRLDTSYYGCESTVYFHTGSFETFSKYQYSGAFGTNAVYLDTSLCNNMRLVAGKKDNLLNEEILISTTVADALVEKSTLGYISEREDLLGLYASGNAINGKSPRVAGIVESDEPAIYLTPLAMAKYLRASGIAPYTSLASDYGITLNEGETILAITAERADISYPAIGETIKIQDREITVVDIMKENGDYLSWLSDKQIQKLSEEEFFTLLVLRESPEAENDKDALGALVLKAAKEHRYEYFDYLYQELDAFLCDLYFFETWDFHLWLYVKLGIEEAKYLYVPEEYYKAIAYKGIYGAYPTEELLSEKYDSLPFAYEQIKSYVKIYEEQFYSTQYASGIYPNSYLVSDADFIAFSKQIGETHPTAQSPKGEVIYDVMPVATADVPLTDYDDSIKVFTVIHSENPDKTEAWLRDTLGEVTFPGGTREVIITPDSVYESIIGEYIENISSDLVTLGIFLLLMSVCMYFIMRASLINRIKEIGIYRAIGVSSKNLVFRFFTESLLLTTLTAFVGYLISSAFLLYTCSSGAMSDTFYYPVWLALAVLVLLYVISLFFGTLPVIALLRKTPSQILAKYDI